MYPDVPPDIQDSLNQRGEELQLAVGTVLFCQGDPSDAVYFVVEGKLKVERGDDTVLNYILPGQITGEIGAMTGWARTATLSAERPSVLRRIPTEEFRAIMRENPTLTRLVMKTTGSHLVSADVERESLGHSYQRMQLRVSSLGAEREQLMELLRLREEMEAMLVHDLKNPLGIITAGIKLLEPMDDSAEDPETFGSVIALMKNATQRMQRLISMLLDIAKMEAGKFSLRLTEINLVALTYALINEQSGLRNSHPIQLDNDDHLQLIVGGDRDVLHRVLVNLVDNAVKFSPKGAAVTIVVRPSGEDWAEIHVNDQGPGIPPEERERIFEKFTQIQGEAHARRRGTGLGLTFCRMAIEAHGGHIWVEPGPEDIGASFRLRLPRAREKGQLTFTGEEEHEICDPYHEA